MWFVVARNTIEAQAGRRTQEIGWNQAIGWNQVMPLPGSAARVPRAPSALAPCRKER